jgi:HAD superfamily hydrolase (TIGR01549 family)
MNESVMKLFEGWRPKVIFWDMWMTLGMSHCREPIGEAQVILSPMQLPIGANRHPIPTGDFLRFCLTNPTADEVTFAEEASTTFGWDLEPHRLDAFKTLIGKEKNCIALFPEVQEVLDFVQSLGFRQGIISNLWAFPSGRLFDDTVLRRYFTRQDIICSFEVRHPKPDKEIFEEACRRFNVRPEDCLMIGDNLTADIKGALSCGMKAALIDRQMNVDPMELIRLSEDGYPPVLYMTDLKALQSYIALCPVSSGWSA